MANDGGPRRPTMHDVARLAGVSHQTVSRYLRGDETVRPSIGERIATAVAQLGYRPNLAARAMRTRRSGHLGVVLPLGGATGSLRMLAGAREEAEHAGYQLDAIMLDVAGADQRQRILGFVEAGIFDGVVSLVELPEPQGEVVRPEPRLVVTGDYDSEMRTMGDIASAEALREMMTRLHAAGHRHVLHLAGSSAWASARSRREVYLAMVRELGLVDHGVVETGWSPDVARQAVLDLPAGSPVTAVIAAEDTLAAAAVRAAATRGWRVPDDLVVTGWDNHTVGAQMLPSLTTVEPDYAAVGRRAVRRLLGALGDADAGRSGRAGESTAEDVVEGAERDGGGSELVTPRGRVIWRESTGSA